MGIFDKFREITKKVSEVETNIYNEKQDYLEIYERNQQLEKEIAERTEELHDANRRILTLQHIWDMMNSSTPLENVLETIVNSTQGELGYMHCAIIRKYDDADGEYCRIVAQSNDQWIKRLNEIIGGTAIQTRKLNYKKDSVFYDTINQNKIIQTRALDLSLKSILPELSQDIVARVLSEQPIKSAIIIPLIPGGKKFGWFCVFSAREELADTETDFLSMFAKQIEMAITIAHLFQTVKQEAVTDVLTGLYNRRYFEESVEKEVQRAKRQKTPFSVIGIDLDHLKQINDTYGHSYGDLAIKTIADILKSNARAIDVPARIGGEEFDVLLPGIASDGAMKAAERIRKAIESKEIETIGHITGSLGVATYLEHTNNVEELLELTDQAMYNSKRNGRNRVTLAKPITETSWQEIAIQTFLDILSKNRVPTAKKLSEDLCQKLKNAENEGENKQESLYMVADMLTKLYNPMHESGMVKNKVLMAVSLAKRFDLPKEEVDNLRVAMLLYDIGNLMISPGLLQKATPLTETEREKIKNHPVIAAQKILKPISYVQDILPIIEHHHENWDGSGYPDKKAKNDIPLTSQIILIIDEYFALTEARPYRPKLSSKDAIKIIHADAGKKWNTTLVDEFISLLEHDIV
ncbi:MAG: diguanylate cyclase [Cyanobacteriota bacterium]|nr:diguanylate cyclase [Cyanobacteriota bacterium]MDY6359528.1 diguanylate cyclase [Cyanobacteriota bacterium]MDY6364081.1 diguanylate cyclase [Cyanobacteriota bacterium]MDY6382938.1 diguanylate cyclase [Cyanobacteriota bacterium]